MDTSEPRSSGAANRLEEYFRRNTGRLIHKWENYFEVYDRHFSRYRGQPINLLEIGVSQGGSLQMWRDYFGDKATIYAIDVDPRCKALEEDGIRILIGSQSDRDFLRRVRNEVPPLDILIDDGGHMMSQQIVAFEELFRHVKESGVYLCEDLHTSYWLRFGGGHRRRGTFVEYSKNWIDALHADHSEEGSLQVSDITRTAHSIHYYEGVVVVEKRPHIVARHTRTGSYSFEEQRSPSAADRVVVAAKRRTLTALNTGLRALRLPGVRWR